MEASMATRTESVGSARGGTSAVRRVTETKAFYKTSEFIVMLAAVIGVAIALNKNLTAWHGWLLITVLASAYMLSRGVAKAGSYEPYTERRDNDY
jgi:hypothetical protein